MTVAKLQPRKRTIVGWRQLERRKTEIRSKMRASHALTAKKVP